MPKNQTKASTPVPALESRFPVSFDVRVYPVKDSKYTLANANVDINGVFAIRGVKVIRGEKGPFVAMPQYKDSHGDYRDICFPCTKEARQQFNDAVLNAYEQSLGQAQQPDGYLDTYFIAAEPEHKWQNLTDCHEMYCAGHMTEAGVAYYQATGKTKLLDICCKLCDHIDRRFGREAGKVTGIPGHEEIELALMRLYQATGEERYRKLAAYFIDERGRDPEFFHKEAAARSWSRTDYMDKQPPSYMQNHKPVREQDTVEGHAVRCMYLLTAAANLAAQNHDEALMAACRKMWDNMVDRRMYITGGIGSTYYGEAFTVDYDLPNDTAYAETCAAVGVCFFAKQMLEADPDARYAVRRNEILLYQSA